MEPILQLLVVLFVIIGGISLFFLLAIQPIWGIVDVAISKEHSGGTKAAVILLTLLLLGPVMTFFYACFSSPSRVFRRFTVTAFVTTLISGVVVIGLAVAAPAVRKKFNLPVAATPQKADTFPGGLTSASSHYRESFTPNRRSTSLTASVPLISAGSFAPALRINSTVVA
jgi:hypothetical protein